MTAFKFIRKGSDFIKRNRRKAPIIKHYAYALTLTAGTFLFGCLLIYNCINVVERVVLFPPGTSNLFGGFMMFLATAKLLTVFRRDSKLKKYVLIGITLCWLTITWAYSINQTQNTGSVMAMIITVICYLELWRGDYPV